MTDYKEKYLKYKTKYLRLQKQMGGNVKEDVSDQKLNELIKNELPKNKEMEEKYNKLIAVKISNKYAYLGAQDLDLFFKDIKEIDTMILLKNNNFSDNYAYLGALNLTEDMENKGQINNMIELKKKGFDENYAYKVASQLTSEKFSYLKDIKENLYDINDAIELARAIDNKQLHTIIINNYEPLFNPDESNLFTDSIIDCMQNLFNRKLGKRFRLELKGPPLTILEKKILVFTRKINTFTNKTTKYNNIRENYIKMWDEYQYLFDIKKKNQIDTNICNEILFDINYPEKFNKLLIFLKYGPKNLKYILSTLLYEFTYEQIVTISNLIPVVKGELIYSIYDIYKPYIELFIVIDSATELATKDPNLNKLDIPTFKILLQSAVTAQINYFNKYRHLQKEQING